MMIFNSFIPVNDYDFRENYLKVNNNCYPEF